jgi:hypothetical protein
LLICQAAPRLKLTCSAELTRIVEAEWLPVLRQPNEFRAKAAVMALRRGVIEGVPKVSFEYARMVAQAA